MGGCCSTDLSRPKKAAFCTRDCCAHKHRHKHTGISAALLCYAEPSRAVPRFVQLRRPSAGTFCCLSNNKKCTKFNGNSPVNGAQISAKTESAQPKLGPRIVPNRARSLSSCSSEKSSSAAEAADQQAALLQLSAPKAAARQSARLGRTERPAPVSLGGDCCCCTWACARRILCTETTNTCPPSSGAASAAEKPEQQRRRRLCVSKNKSTNSSAHKHTSALEILLQLKIPPRGRRSVG